jgi:hypothetical protein
VAVLRRERGAGTSAPTSTTSTANFAIVNASTATAPGFAPM